MNNISFPKLGLSFNIDPVAFNIGRISIYWYAVIIVTGFLLGFAFSYFSAKKRGVNPDNILDVALWGMVAGIVGARIYYVIFSWDEFSGNLLNIFNTRSGGLAIYGGIIGAAVSTLIYCHVKKLNFFEIADICAPGLLIGQAIGRFGNFVNCEVYGGVTDSILGMSINGGEPVHPLFLYEAAWNILGLILIIIFRDKKRNHGQVFAGYIAWYSIGRLFLEGMRQSQYILYLIPNVLGISQLVSALMFIAAVAFLVYLHKRTAKTPVTKNAVDSDNHQPSDDTEK